MPLEVVVEKTRHQPRRKERCLQREWDSSAQPQANDLVKRFRDAQVEHLRDRRAGQNVLATQEPRARQDALAHHLIVEPIQTRQALDQFWLAHEGAASTLTYQEPPVCQ